MALDSLFASRRNTRKRIGLTAICAAILLTACGGGTDDAASASASTSAAAGSRESAKAADPLEGFFPAAASIPADAHLKGMWSPVYKWSMIPIHVVLLPDGRVLSFGTNADGRQTGNFIYSIWDGVTRPDDVNGHMVLPNQTSTDLFCASQVLLPVGQGSVVIAGGDNWNGTKTLNTGNANSTIFNAGTNILSRGPDMKRPRWYSTATTLTTGEVYIQGGSGGLDFPEVRQVDGTFRLLTTDTTWTSSLYPRNFVMPDGRVFGYGSAGNLYFIDPTGNGVMTRLGMLDRSYAGYTATAAMFRPGRILQIGATYANAAVVIDLNSGKPVFTPTQPLTQIRNWVTSTILPDGKVLATGGSPIDLSVEGANNLAEIWDPQTGQWTQGSAGALARLYHSTALLRPDGSVLVGGGGAPGPLTNTNVEVYYPPYFFAPGGKLATRPEISTAPAFVDIGQTFGIKVPAGQTVSRVTLIKTGAVTHAFNMEQRFVDLTFKANGTDVAIQAPTRAGEATPGYYHLFVFDQAGVPSKSKIVRIGVAAVKNPNVVPTLANPGGQTSKAAANVRLALAGSDPNGDKLSYAATGLPPGLAIDPATGVISGVPNAPGNFNVVATTSDGINTASAAFVWSVTGNVALTLDAVSVASPLLTGTSVTYTAAATGANPRYKWNFGDGSAETAYAATGSVAHTYAQPGLHYVTLTVTDNSNLTVTRTFLQTVYRAATAKAPTASSNIAIESRAAGNARLWVANQDNGSVSVFDTVTQARLAEIPTGNGPRSLAVAADGKIWVVNKFAPNITVIDPATLAITRTLWMPRGSQPFGVAMSPTTATAYITLEASGQVLAINTASFTQTGALAVGASPRHVSVSADGANVYVSRFITPPLPGESTVAVNTAGEVGGEIVKVATATMAIQSRVILHHGNREDAENQGRGIPNYLGALAISPDGTQGWIPSKLDNVKRGALRDGLPLNFQNTVRAVSSRVVMATGQEDLAARIDHDNASVASAAAYDPRGVVLFVALETSRQVAAIDVNRGVELMRLEVGRAPQGLAVSADGSRLYVNNFMDRTVGVYDLRPLLNDGLADAPILANWPTITTETLAANVLQGKRLFYDARDRRLARDAYLSCATCHNDGGQDGRVWDLGSQGEGLRNTISLRGRVGGMGFRHWSGNFDETQDFEGQIRTLAGGTGLMTDAQFNTGTRSQPLGALKAGVSADLDALAAYVASLNTFDISPYRAATGLSDAALAGRAVFTAKGCGTCHSGAAFTNSGRGNLVDIGTIKPSSGQRLGAALTGIDVPTLRDVWQTAPYLHDGSAPTLAAAITAHRNVAATTAEVNSLADYLREIGREEVTAP